LTVLKHDRVALAVVDVGVVAAIVQKFTLSRPKNGLLQLFFTRKLPKWAFGPVYCVLNQ
jgi:hypothetical protein